MPEIGFDLGAVVEIVGQGGMDFGQRDPEKSVDDFLGNMPRISCQTTMSITRMRCPAIHALPPQTPGVFVM